MLRQTACPCGPAHNYAFSMKIRNRDMMPHMLLVCIIYRGRLHRETEPCIRDQAGEGNAEQKNRLEILLL
jgi:hypothetical protein